MQYIIGAVMAFVFTGGLGAAFYVGYRLGRRVGAPRSNAPLGAADEARKQKAERLKKEFEIISSYNLTKALERKQVTHGG